MLTIVPRVRYLKTNNTKLVIIRWPKYGMDIALTPEFNLFQYGRVTSKVKWKVNFICKVKNKVRPPTFLMSFSWRTKFTLFGVRFGKTKNPQNLSKLWEALCQDSGHYQNGNLKTSRISSGNG